MNNDRRQALAAERLATATEALAQKPSRDTSRQGSASLPLFSRLQAWVLASESASRRATVARRTFPIHAYVGPNGGGKSLAMVKDTLPSLYRGRRVISTVRLIDPRTGENFANYEPFLHADQLLEARDADILMDEMVGIANSREAGSLDPRVQNVLVQLRRRNCVVRWTAPNWARADKIVREVTQAVTECRGFAADRRPQLDPVTGEPRMWAPKRLFRFATYDTVDFEEWTSGRRDQAETVTREWFVGAGSEAFSAYDTLDAVTMVAGMNKGGQCQVCGGTVKRTSVCRCGAPHALPDAHVHELAS